MDRCINIHTIGNDYDIQWVYYHHNLFLQLKMASYFHDSTHKLAIVRKTDSPYNRKFATTWESKKIQPVTFSWTV